MDTHQPSPERDLTGQRDVGAVIHAIRILQHLSAATAPLGVAAVARGTGISPSTCFNILRTLTRARFVAFREQDKTYSLGLGVAELAAGFLGISHAELGDAPWLKDIAPSEDLRHWFAHDPAKWPEFRRRYTAELDANPQAVAELRRLAAQGPLVLLYAARDEQHNNAVVLRDYLGQ